MLKQKRQKIKSMTQGEEKGFVKNAISPTPCTRPQKTVTEGGEPKKGAR